jgi:myo-inositol 2-dehydrogenase/D-chiro-inositol 1-dehydrogenase
MDTVRVGIIGSGFVAELHAEALRRVPNARLVAVASPTAAHAQAFAARFEVPRWFTDHETLLRDGGVDLITVACPNDLHAPVTLAAADAGVHVICEKPLCLSLREADQMIEACRRAGVMLMYAEELLFAPKYVRAKHLVEEGGLGRVYLVKQGECHYGPHSDWFWDVTRSGGGVLMDMGCHSVEFGRWIYDKARPVSVYAHLGRFAHTERTRGEDQSICLVEYEGGRLAIAENSWARTGGIDDRAELYGDQGLTIADLIRGNALTTFSNTGYGYAVEKAPETRGWSFTGFEEMWNYGFPQEMQHFVDCVAHDRVPVESGEDGRVVLEILCAAYLSARLGRKVSLQDPLPPDVAAAARPIDLWLGPAGQAAT